MKLGKLEVAVGDVLLLAPEEGEEDDEVEEGAEPAAPLGLVQALWQTSSGAAGPPRLEGLQGSNLGLQGRCGGGVSNAGRGRTPVARC